MSKAVKTVVSVVAAVAIPFVAPVIASSIGLSAAIGTAVGSATAGSVIGGALTGAALGAAKSAVLGEDVGRGAIMGGIGGGIGGYTAAPTSAPTTSPYSLAEGTTAPAVSAPATGAVDYSLSAGGTPSLTGAPSAGAGLSGAMAPVDYSLGAGTAATGLSGATTGGVGLTMPATFGGEAATGLSSAAGFAPVDYSLAAGAQFPTVGLNPATAGFGFRAPDPGFFNAAVGQSLAAGTPIDYSLAAGMPPSQGLQVVSANPITGGTQVTTGAGTFQSTTPISQYSGGSYVGPTGAAATPIAQGGTGATTTPTGTTGATTTPTGTTGAGQAPMTYTEALKARVTSPEGLADMTLRAAGLLAGSAIAGDGLSSEERELLRAQTDELRMLQQTNRALFEQRLEQAQNVIGESKYFDPEYFGLQRARRAQLAGAKAKRSGLRGLTGAAREAESRRFDLAIGREVGTSFDQGYLTGVQGRLGTMQAGLNMMPSAFPSSMGDYTYLRGAYGSAADRARQTQRDIGDLFGSLTGGSRSQSRGPG